MLTKANLSKDLYTIINNSELIGEKDEPSNIFDVEPKNDAYKDVRKWHTFKNIINFNGELYNVLTKVREKDNGNFAYSVKFLKIKNNST